MGVLLGCCIRAALELISGNYSRVAILCVHLSNNKMPETADVVIIGSGIVGSSVAYNLAEQGCTNVLVIEREAHQGKGSTGKSMGGVPAQFATPVNIQMSRYSIDFFGTFDEVVGHPADYRPHGYLFCATSE